MFQYVNQSDLEQQAGPTVRPLQGLQGNKRGSSQDFPLGHKGTLVDCRTDSLDAEMLSLSFGAVLNGKDAIELFETVDLVATIEWGIGSSQFTAEIDFLHGMTLSLPTNYLRVSAEHRGAVSPFTGESSTFQLSAGVGYGSFTEMGGNPQRTVRLGPLANTGILFAPPIPAFATSFTVFASSATIPFPAGLQINVDSGLASLALYTYDSISNNANQGPTTYPLPNAADQIVFQNLTGHDLLSLGIIYNLSL